MKKEINGVEIEVLTGNIARQNDMAAVVNAVNAQLMMAAGQPAKDAAEIALETTREQTPKLEYVEKVRMVLYSDADCDTYERILSE